MHVIDIILHEIEVERKLIVNSLSSSSPYSMALAGDAGNGKPSANSNIGNSGVMMQQQQQQHNNEELGYDYVIQALHDDCHPTILRYCSDCLGAVRRDGLNRIAANGSAT
jgi:hypothetical protein